MNIAILGLGTIGSGVYELLKGREDIKVKRILDIRCWMDCMTTDIADIINDESIECVVETMGGIHPAREYALKCINAGKSYVSANKLLISACA
ncbi:MAG: homoserine dehydrogenase, partial [Clostridia bacterium]|nr:homoserine dehydrogenase [Clostridia bacterium]